ncbi:kinase-like domain-containing protein [Mycena pura]|uniref:Kinase-like domain-containing protein n=1 Tax=Mycena pura TaxID=153505 RepID=A0AAD6YKU2_9AGAR|nr:kinase-like domain-containing protein [Mycena pura]
MPPSQLWSTACEAFNLVPNMQCMNPRTVDLLHGPPSGQLDITQLGDDVAGIDIARASHDLSGASHDLSGASRPTFQFSKYLNYIRPVESTLVKAFDHPAVAGSLDTAFVQVGDWEEKRKFTAMLYALILRRCRQNSCPNERTKKSLRYDSNVKHWRGPLISSSIYGDVFLLYDNNNKRVLAKKRFHPEGRKLGEVKNEITQTLLKLEHPNIVSFIDVNYVHPNLDVVMEYVEGGTVRRMVEVLGPIAEGDARRICRQLVAGLEYLHYQSPPIVHQDIRGANLLITLDGCIKISDVGLPRPEIIPGYAEIGPGIVAWMAPEVMLRKHYTPGVDIWGVASTLIEMVEGGHPWASREKGPFLLMQKARPSTSILAYNMHIPSSVSADLRDLLTQIFVPADTRLSIQGVKSHRAVQAASSSRSACLAAACDTAVDDKDPEDDEPPYGNLVGYAQSFLQNPYYFMFASLAKPDDDTDGRTLHDRAS